MGLRLRPVAGLAYSYTNPYFHSDGNCNAHGYANPYLHSYCDCNAHGNRYTDGYVNRDGYTNPHFHSDCDCNSHHHSYPNSHPRRNAVGPCSDGRLDDSGTIVENAAARYRLESCAVATVCLVVRQGHYERDSYPAHPEPVEGNERGLI